MPPRLILSNPWIGPTLSLPAHGRKRFFSSTSRHLAEAANHYETLGVSPNATQTEIKRQFYSLSKFYHPDLRRDDPHAGDRFSEISNAYSVLANPDKRKKYDRDHMHRAASFTAPRSDSHSSGSFAGSRPASGLSKRRATFRGPPPSFYAQGGRDAPRRETGNETGRTSTAPGGGFGPGGAASGLDHDVPHFDREGHFRTQTDQDHRRRRRRHNMMAGKIHDADAELAAGSMLFRFVVVSGIIGFAVWAPSAISNMFSRKKGDAGEGGRKSRKNGDG